MLRQALVRLGFRFPDEEQERLFVERFVLIHLRTSQLFLLATGLLFCSYFLWDRAVDHDHWKRVFVFREFVLSPILFAAAALLFIGRVQPRLETIVTFAWTTTLVGFEVICANLDSAFRYGAAGLVLIYFGGAAMFPLRLSFLVVP